MRLSEFLLSHRAQILSEWDAFARSRVGTAGGLDLATLRDHASEMLVAIAADLNTPQSKAEQADKSEGKRDADPDSATPDTPAQSHGAARAESGFTVEEMVSEYRALRATVIRLWIDAAGELALTDLRDLIRFNEAIDQDLAESTARFAQDLDHSKEIFLAMLGHDLRTPLGAIIGSAHLLVTAKELPPTLLKSASLILSSGRRMDALVGNLLDFTRSRLGSGIPIVRAEMDLAKVCGQTIEEVTAFYPGRVVHCSASGNLRGEWDRARVGQVLSNVIGNAAKYGSENTPINVSMHGDADEVAIEVRNSGPVIPANQLNQIFEPMHRVEGDQPAEPTSNLGLGLYIAERIVAAHGGHIAVESSEEKGTTFTIHLPRHAASETPFELVAAKSG